MPINELLTDLNKAYADEWCALYQYWYDALITEGINAPIVAEHLKKQALDEMKHAEKIGNRILELGGTPVSRPDKLVHASGCGYIDPPKDKTDLKQIIQDTLKAERCAIEAYNRLAKMTLGKDPVTYELASDLLTDEVSDEEEFENLLANL
ncbi:MAG: ferritin [Thaumarchaeota archaeon]|nr:ferritin [Nitrososphaerota archaeon]